jgi:dTDP-4-amino-4,6-dideoxygalactose transaminase
MSATTSADHARPMPFLDLAPMTEEVRADVVSGWERLLRSGDFVGGEAVSRFEREWADYCGAREAVGVGNGTDALQLSLRALGVGAGHEVIVPANTFVATAEAVVLAGAVPRFVDVDPASLLITAEAIEQAVTSNTRAVIVVHLFGHMPDMDRIDAMVKALGLHLLEDAAQAHGASWGPRKAGAFGAAGCFSFYPGKNLGAFGDAGAVVTSDPELAEAVRSLRDHGRTGKDHHEHARLGTNSRLDALQAVVLSAKLPRLDAWNEARRACVERYGEVLDDRRAPLLRQVPGGRGAHHLAVVRVRERARVRAALSDVGVATGIHYPTPCHRVAPFRQYGGHAANADRAAERILSLPLFPHMSSADVDRVATTVNRICRGGPGLSRSADRSRP